MKVGEVAGVAAAMAARRGVCPRKIAVTALRTHLGIDRAIEKALSRRVHVLGEFRRRVPWQ